MKENFALCFVAWNVGREKESFQAMAWKFYDVDGATYNLVRL